VGDHERTGLGDMKISVHKPVWMTNEQLKIIIEHSLESFGGTTMPKTEYEDIPPQTERVVPRPRLQDQPRMYSTGGIIQGPTAHEEYLKGFVKQGEPLVESPYEMPPTVRIGAITYKISTDVEDWHTCGEDLNQAWSFISYTKATIGLHPEQDIQLMRINLMHEILHGVTWAVESDRSHVKMAEEAFVTSVSPTLVDTMQRNQELFRWIMWTF
jgi:hypothetical protein